MKRYKGRARKSRIEAETGRYVEHVFEDGKEDYMERWTRAETGRC
jgi:hypothetical protein